MTTQKTVLALRYSAYWTSPLFGLGARLVLVTLPGESARITNDHADQVLRLYEVSSFDSIEQLAAIAADLRASRIQVDAIASPTEASQYAAGVLSDLLSVDTAASQVIVRTRDKRLMKITAHEAKVATPRWMSVPDLGRNVAADGVISVVGLPLVIKPANGWGASSTYRVTDAHQLTTLLDDYPLHPELSSSHLIAEEFIHGVEYHVDAVWHDGEPWFLSVSQYFKPRLALWTEGGLNGTYILPESRNRELYEEVLAIHRRLNPAVGIRHGATHLELIQDSVTGRFVLTDLASRLGGGAISEMVGAYCGVDLRRLWAQELIGGKRIDITSPADDYVGMLNLAPSVSGKLVRLPDDARLAEDEAVVSHSNIFKVGDRIEVEDATAWCTLLIIRADTEDQLVAHADRLVREYPVDVDST